MNKRWQVAFWSMGCLLVGVTAARLLAQGDPLYRYGKDVPEVLYLVDRAYVEDVDLATLMPGMLQNALDQVDPNASYLPAGEQPRDYAAAAYAKSGLVLARREHYPYILYVAGHSPAHKAGLKAGDIIKVLGEHRTRDLSLHAMEKLLAEWPREELSCTLGDLYSLDVETRKLKFENFDLPTVSTSDHAEDIVVITLPGLTGDWHKALRKSLSKYRRKAPQMILDLRGNALGGESELEALLETFMAKGTMGHWVKKDGSRRPIINRRDGLFLENKLLILVDRHTGQAAEAFAALAQSQKRAQVVGKSTLGKATHYHFVPLRDGSHLKMAVEKLQTLGGTSHLPGGVAPDRELEDAAMKPEVVLDTAVNLLQTQLADPKEG